MELSALEAVCLASSVALSSVFYHLYRRQRAAVRRIEAAPRLQVGAELRTLMGSSQELCYAVLEGRVEAVGTPLCSQNHPHLQAVIQKHQMIEHRLFWNSLTRSWSEYVQIMHESVKSVPFQLCPLEDNEVSVLVCDPLHATGLTLETVYERFHAASLGLGELIGHYLSGEKPTGILETEAILPVGRVLTGLGQLTLNNKGVIILQPPQDGSKYVLSLTGYDDILYQQECAAHFWRGAAFICGTLGAVVLCISLYRAYQRHKEQHRQEECWDELHTEGEIPDEDMVASERLCIICISRPRECVILPCGHVCCCFLCYQALPSEICPICRCHIQRIVPLYQA